jgi:hypothetical protein
MAIAIVITPPFKPLPNKEDGKSGKSASVKVFGPEPMSGLSPQSVG